MNPALLAAFKSQVAGLVDHCKLEPVQIVTAGLSLAASRAAKSGLDYDALHLALDQQILKAGALIDGAEKALAAVKDAGGMPPDTEGVKLDG